MDHLIHHVIGLHAFGEELEILDTLADVHTHLVGEYETVERLAESLSSGCLGQEIVVPREREPLQETVEKLWNGKLRALLPGGKAR